MAGPIAIVIGGMTTGLIVASFMKLWPPLGPYWERVAFKQNPTRIPSLGDLIEMLHRNEIEVDEFYDLAVSNGYKLDYINKFITISRSLLPAGDIIAAWRRGIISDQVLDEKLRSLKYSNDDISTLLAVSEFFPSPPDLVRFAIREVFTPAIAEKYGLFMDMPEEYLNLASQAGLSEIFAQSFWAAHWELPSPTQAYEMLHRGYITEADLTELLRAQDYMPYWRDKLVSISYNPLTRVDVRRMYRLGVIDRNAVKKNYKDLGYNDDNAELMTQFTEKYESDEEAGITKANIISAYKEYAITQDDAINLLAYIGYAEYAIEFLIGQAAYEMAQDEEKNILDDLFAQYRLGLIDWQTLQAKCYALSLPATQIQALLRKEQVNSTAKMKIPTLNDVTSWYKLGMIADQDYYNKLQVLGYRDEDIINYMEEARRELEDKGIKYLPYNIYKKWYDTGLIDDKLFISRLKAIGYQDRDIEAALMKGETNGQRQG